MDKEIADRQAWYIRKRAKRKKHRKGAPLNKQDKQYCQLNLFVTNIPIETVSADDIHKLYKIRWQVELLFKAWKSILKIDAVRKMKASRLKWYLYSKLLCWDICRK